METREITHFYERPTEKDLWVPIYFITRDSQGVYHPGYESHPFIDDQRRPVNDINKFGLEGIIALEEPIKVIIGSDKKSNSLWLTPNSEIYFASEEDPIGDPNRKLVQRLVAA